MVTLRVTILRFAQACKRKALDHGKEKKRMHARAKPLIVTLRVTMLFLLWLTFALEMSTKTKLKVFKDP